METHARFGDPAEDSHGTLWRRGSKLSTFHPRSIRGIRVPFAFHSRSIRGPAAASASANRERLNPSSHTSGALPTSRSPLSNYCQALASGSPKPHRNTTMPIKQVWLHSRPRPRSKRPLHQNLQKHSVNKMCPPSPHAHDAPTAIVSQAQTQVHKAASSKPPETFG